jgi:catechol 2,3-dioxygenase-like lactoylglutathione lyase family enzyme
VKPPGVIETCLYVDDLAAAEQFYTRLFGLEVLAREPRRHCFFRCGSGVLLLFNPERTSSEPAEVGGVRIPLHGARGAGHVALAMEDGEIAAWRARLAERGVAIEAEVRWPNGGHSLYFRDPAGNSVELVTRRTWRLHDAG